MSETRGPRSPYWRKSEIGHANSAGWADIAIGTPEFPDKL